MSTSDTDHTEALQRAAKGLYPTEAAIQLLIDTGMADRIGYAIETSDGDSAAMAWIDWDILLDGPWSGGERRLLQIAHALYTETLDVTGLNEDWIGAVTNAIRHAAGLHQR